MTTRRMKRWNDRLSSLASQASKINPRPDHGNHPQKSIAPQAPTDATLNLAHYPQYTSDQATLERPGKQLKPSVVAPLRGIEGRYESIFHTFTPTGTPYGSRNDTSSYSSSSSSEFNSNVSERLSLTPSSEANHFIGSHRPRREKLDPAMPIQKFDSFASENQFAEASFDCHFDLDLDPQFDLHMSIFPPNLPDQVDDKSKIQSPKPNNRTERKKSEPPRSSRPLSSTTGICNPTLSTDDNVGRSEGLQHKGDCLCVQRSSGSTTTTSNKASIGRDLCYSDLIIPSRTTIRESNLSNSSTCSTDDSTTSSDYEDDIVFDANQSILGPLREPLLEKLISAYFCDVIGRGPEQEETEKTKDKIVSDSATSERQIGSGPQLPGNQNSTKRKLGGLSQGRDDGEGEDEDEEPVPPEKKQAMPLKEGVLLACPFAKWKPLSYPSCCKYIMKDIRRVKQHLRRNHKRPLHCPTCWNTFKDEHTFYSHIESRACLPQPKVELEGLTTTQQEFLERKVNRKLSRSDQWYSIFLFLFPNSPRPESAYLESSLSAELLSFQKFMAVDGLEIVEQTAREQIPADLIPQTEEIVAFSQVLFQQAIPKILKKYEATNPHSSSPDSSYGTSSNASSNGRPMPDGHKLDDWGGMETILEVKHSTPEELGLAGHQVNSIISLPPPNTTSGAPVDTFFSGYDFPDAFFENVDTFGIEEDFTIDWDKLYGEVSSYSGVVDGAEEGEGGLAKEAGR